MHRVAPARDTGNCAQTHLAPKLAIDSPSRGGGDRAHRAAIAMHPAAFALTTATAVLFLLLDVTKRSHGAKSEQNEKPFGDISLWIDEQQVKTFSGTVPTR